MPNIQEFRIKTKELSKKTKGPGDILDLTPDLTDILEDLGLNEGTMTVFIVGSTAGITTIEYEPGLKKDMSRIWERLAPQKEQYHHHETWGDYNGFSHCRAAIQGPAVTIPFNNGALCLGQWQQVVLMEFDDRPRARTLIVQVMGCSL